MFCIYIPLLTGHLDKYGDDDGGGNDVRDDGNDDGNDTKGSSLICLLLHVS